VPTQRVPGAKIDGPRYKWNGVYNQYLGGGILCAPCVVGGSRGVRRRGREGRAGQGGAGAKKETRLLARFASSGSGFSVLVYISLTGASPSRPARGRSIAVAAATCIRETSPTIRL
jgi:hypothetical protein